MRSSSKSLSLPTVGKREKERERRGALSQILSQRPAATTERERASIRRECDTRRPAQRAIPFPMQICAIRRGRRRRRPTATAVACVAREWSQPLPLRAMEEKEEEQELRSCEKKLVSPQILNYSDPPLMPRRVLQHHGDFQPLCRFFLSRKFQSFYMMLL